MNEQQIAIKAMKAQYLEKNKQRLVEAYGKDMEFVEMEKIRACLETGSVTRRDQSHG